MRPLFTQSIDYTPHTEALFNKIRHLPWAAYIDSQNPYCTQGKVDILSANPYATLYSKNQKTTVKINNETHDYIEDPIWVLKKWLPQQQISEDFPFVGGAIGYFGYDVGLSLLHIQPKGSQPYPEMMVGLYDWAIIVDHEKKTAHIVSALNHQKTKTEIDYILSLLQQQTTARKAFRLTTDLASNMSFNEYKQAFHKIKQYIKNGDCYQVNFSQCFNATFQGSPWSAYCHLRQNNPSPFSAFLHFDDVTILSFSPEQFLTVNGQQVLTKPIKGTRPRHQDKMQDAMLANQLLQSEKDKAENLMIVDLLRNDLGKNCKVGSISVPHLFQLESFSNVHHLVSTIEGELKHDQHPLDLLRDCFPGGSVTGAPKKRAMEIINELEPTPRGIYCGSIGYISYDGKMNTNIAIRTLICYQDTIACQAGGALVYDSVLVDEYQETLDKINNLLRLLREF